ncbi:MAG TPA: aminodeoxychorismate/anthranilate synthase component II [Bacteroidales bacterium]|nr:aminodeoxychorismate/anthranilate synthase component II [Bacteroidales bacterium]HOK97647.1 aminodeoxychorismate/anthranilate synthase component II [Bacteroidales bacterium]HPO64797.1 aminodeoxychorismate/anthranilate synthase component II [Bacteroidales bacterium]
MKIVVLDNYDSFTYNLVHAIEKIVGQKIVVVRNDEVEPDFFKDFDKIVLSPGPGLPDESGILKPVIQRWAAEKSIFGVCLGLQAIGEVFGAQLENLNQVYHGVATTIIQTVNDEPIFEGVPEIFDAGRYHSWIVSRNQLPDCLEVTAIDKQGQIMAARHKTYDVKGVQFHPESILTPFGEKIIANWLFHSAKNLEQ